MDLLTVLSVCPFPDWGVSVCQCRAGLNYHKKFNIVIYLVVGGVNSRVSGSPPSFLSENIIMLILQEVLDKSISQQKLNCLKISHIWIVIIIIHLTKIFKTYSNNSGYRNILTIEYWNIENKSFGCPQKYIDALILLSKTKAKFSPPQTQK